MPVAHQPIDRVPNLAATGFVAGWLNKGVLGMGDAAMDYGPDGYDMTRFNSPRQERVGVTFNGIDNYIHSGTAPDGTGAVTVTFWMYPRQVAGSQIIAYFSDGDISDDFLVIGTFNSTILASGNDLAADSRQSGTIMVDQWQHVAVTKEAGAVTAVYINAVDVTAAAAAAWSAGNAHTAIGASYRLGVGSEFFNGSIKDVRYYNVELDPSDILYMYKQSVPDDSLVLWTPGGMTDRSRYERVLTRFNSVICGAEMHFDSGTNDYISTPAIDFVDQSVSLWFKPDSVGNNELLFNNVPNANNRTVIAIRDDGTVRAARWNGAVYYGKSGGTYEVGKWNHVAMSHDATHPHPTIVTLNREVLVGTDDPSSGNGISLRIGMSSSGTSPYNGLIRDVRVWNEAKPVGFLLGQFDKGEGSA